MAEQKKNSSAKATNKRGNTKTPPPLKRGSKVRDEIFSIIIIAFGIFLAIAIQTPAAGAFGKILHDFFLGCFGMLAYALPYYLIVYGILLILNKTVHITGKSFTLMMTIFIMAAFINSARFIDVENFSFSAKALSNLFDMGIAKKNGGFIGMFLGTLIAKAVGKSGLLIFSSVVILICLLLVINTPISQFIETCRVKRAIRLSQKAEMAEQQAREEEEREIERRVEKKYADLEKQKKEERLAIASNTLKAGEGASDAKDHASDKSKGKASDKINEKNDAKSSEKLNEHKEMDAYTLAKIKQSQENILNYMRDDNLFDVSTEASFGSENGFDGENGEVSSSVNVSNSSNFSNASNASNVSNSGNDVKTAKKLSKAEASGAMLSDNEINMGNEPKDKPYQFPSIELLTKSKADTGNSDMILREKAIKLEDTLKNFHVDAKVVQVTQGPAVTRYEIQPSVGVKVSSIVRLADDIALNLEAKSIRIEAPIPGKAAVGIEVENDKINFVNLRDIIGSKQFKEAKSKISFAVGKDISGNAVVGDLKSMPHMLIAGSTGSGKSVCVNSIILSILYKAKPEEVKLVLIDPKVVELGNYNGIPHLLIPVVTEPGKAAAALNWAVAEMTDRYKKFAEEGVRDLESFNDSVKQKNENDRVMPQIVIIIDELADLMMAAPSQVEESICRLAQMARAAGMHLIVATQRPSVDVVTGVIKANIPSRIAFAVSSQVDSRTIIDMGGAEKLVGKGDMLYNPLGIGKPIRVQGAFVSDSEVHKVIEHVKGQIETAEYSSDVIQTIEKGNTPIAEDDGDELLAEVIEAVVHAKQASVSMLQRRFRIGYNRAARIVDMMEARGVIGPADGSRPRQVLLSEEELYELQNDTQQI